MFMTAITVAVIEIFHPQIVAAIKAGMPAAWTVNFTPENSMAARAETMRGADIVFVIAAPMPAELPQEAHRLRFIPNLGACPDRTDLHPLPQLCDGRPRARPGTAHPAPERAAAAASANHAGAHRDAQEPHFAKLDRAHPGDVPLLRAHDRERHRVLDQWEPGVVALLPTPPLSTRHG